MIRSRRLELFVALHVLISGAVAVSFAWLSDHNWRDAAAHVVLLAEWDLLLVLAFRGFPAARRWPGTTYRALMTLTCALQVCFYALNFASNLSWGRNITGHLIVAFAPTVWSGREAFPLGKPGIVAFACAALVVAGALVAWARPDPTARMSVSGSNSRALVRVAMTAGAAALFAFTLDWGIDHRDDLPWKRELIASFFRPDAIAFEPTPRRDAAAARDAVLQASYVKHAGANLRKNVVLIIVDSLRADRMQVYGYERETTPFLMSLVQSGRMKRVEAAFSSCSESLCGITSTLASRELRDLSSHTFDLQDVLRDEGYRTWFLLSGNHSAWNGLAQFYRADPGTLFDGSQTTRYTMDDDRLVLEGLERVPAAGEGIKPAFFYVHLMSPHYLGVQLPESHVFTRPDDVVSAGLEPYKILDKLNNPDRYDDKVRQSDEIIRQLFGALAAKHYLDDAIVVVTGDHGEGLGERHRAHGWDLYDEDIRIPLLIYDAPPAAYPDLTFAAQVDIAPTIVDRLGLPIPSSWQGESLLRASRTRFTYHQTYFIPNRFAVLYRDGDQLYKFIATPQYGKEELFDLRADSKEVTNLVNEQRALAELLRGKVREYRSE